MSELFVNEGGRFREVGRETGVGYAPKSGMNATVGDVLNQGRFAIYVSNISEEGILIQGNNLWVPTGGDAKTLPTYENLARSMNIDLGGWSFGAQFGDLNNDGAQDLYLVNGYVSASRTESYWYDYSKVAGGSRGRHLRREELAGDGRAQPCRLPGQARAGSTTARAGSSTWRRWSASTDRHDGRSVALADFANRGVLDVVVANQRGPLLLYRNDVAPGRGWIDFDLEGGCRPDTTASRRCSNRDAIGAQVTLHWQGSSRCRRCSAAPASAPRTSAGCTSGWARRPPSTGR